MGRISTECFVTGKNSVIFFGFYLEIHTGGFVRLLLGNRITMRKGADIYWDK